MDTDSALKQYPDLFKEYFGKVISYADNKFSALNSAVWSGGSFIYVPKGVKIENHYNHISVLIQKVWGNLSVH